MSKIIVWLINKQFTEVKHTNSFHPTVVTYCFKGGSKLKLWWAMFRCLLGVKFLSKEEGKEIPEFPKTIIWRIPPYTSKSDDGLNKIRTRVGVV